MPDSTAHGCRDGRRCRKRDSRSRQFRHAERAGLRPSGVHRDSAVAGGDRIRTVLRPAVPGPFSVSAARAAVRR